MDTTYYSIWKNIAAGEKGIAETHFYKHLDAICTKAAGKPFDHIAIDQRKDQRIVFAPGKYCIADTARSVNEFFLFGSPIENPEYWIKAFKLHKSIGVSVLEEINIFHEFAPRLLVKRRYHYPRYVIPAAACVLCVLTAGVIYSAGGYTGIFDMIAHDRGRQIELDPVKTCNAPDTSLAAAFNSDSHPAKKAIYKYQGTFPASPDGAGLRTDSGSHSVKNVVHDGQSIISVKTLNGEKCTGRWVELNSLTPREIEILKQAKVEVVDGRVREIRFSSGERYYGNWKEWSIDKYAVCFLPDGSYMTHSDEREMVAENK